MGISDTRYQLSLFAMFDYESVENRLEKMAAKGWKIESTGVFFWKYVRATPKKKKYAVVFSKDTSEYNPYPTDGQHLLRKLCNDDGWEKEAEWKQMEIFSTDNVEKNLETDEMVRLSSIRRAMKKTFIPCWTIALVGMLFLALQNMARLYTGNAQDEYGTLWAVIITMYAAFVSAAVLISYRIWLKLSEGAIREGGKCVSARWHRRMQDGLCIGLFILAGVYLLGDDISYGLSSIAYVLIYLVILIMVVIITNLFGSYLKLKGFSKKSNMICSGVMCVALIILALIVLKASRFIM